MEHYQVAIPEILRIYFLKKLSQGQKDKFISSK